MTITKHATPRAGLMPLNILTGVATALIVLAGCQGPAGIPADATSVGADKPSSVPGSPTSGGVTEEDLLAQALELLPAQPKQMDARALSPGAVALSWRHDEHEASGYTVYRAQFPDMNYEPIFSGPLVDGTFVDTFVTPQDRYFYFVEAYNALGSSLRSRVSNAVVPSLPTLETPRLHGSDFISGPFQLRWAYDDASVSAFELEWSYDFFASVAARTEIAATSTGGVYGHLITPTKDEAGTMVAFRVRAIDADSGASEFSKDLMVYYSKALLDESEVQIVDLPSVSNDGSYTLTMACARESSPDSWVIQQATDPSFVEAATYTRPGDGNTVSYAFTEVPDGTYYYRASLYPDGPFSEPRAVTVERPERRASTLRIVNNAPYDIVSIELNGQEVLLTEGWVLPAGSFIDWGVIEPGIVEYEIRAGVVNGLGGLDLWFVEHNLTETSLDGQTTIEFAVTLGDLLTRGELDGHLWQRQYEDGSARSQRELYAFRFSPDASWELFLNDASVRTGMAQVIRWDRNSPVVSFRLCEDCEMMTMAFPFDSFHPSVEEGQFIPFVAE